MTTNIVTSPSRAATEEQIQIRRARQGLLVFAGFLIPFSLFGYWFNKNYPDLPLNFPTWPLMFAPGVASVITRLLRREGFADVSFRFRGDGMKSAIQLAFLLPLVVGIVAYGTAFLLGLAKFDPPPFPFAVGSPLAQFGVLLVFAAIAGGLMVLPTTACEEIGWRGYLLPRLMDAHIPQPILVTSLIWGAWHLPAVFIGVFAVGPSVWTSAAGIMLTSLAFGYILAWLRLRSGSIWPCIFAHAAWNALINGAFTPAVQNPESNLWIGEKGILVLVTLTLAAIVIRRFWKAK